MSTYRKLRGLSLLALACLTLLLPSCDSVDPAFTADLILTNGKIVTVDPDLPEAEAVAIQGYRILAVGTSEEMDFYRGARTRVIDLEGKLAVPGFIDSHGHYMGLGNSKMNTNAGRRNPYLRG